MGLLVLAFVGGILTILSPCILPVLPFVFARVDQSFRKTGLPLLAGMALTFVAVAAVATGSARWVVRANQIGRDAALIIMALLGITLLWPGLATRLSRPFVRLGSEIERSSKTDFQPGVFQSVLLGVATGLLWAPCAGPILGLVLTGAALSGAGARTAMLLLAYAVGAAVSLGVALLAGGRVFALMKRSLRAEAWIRGALGVLVLAGVVAIGFGLDRGLLTRLSLASTSEIEQSLINRVQPPAKTGSPAMMMMSSHADAKASGPAVLPELNAVAWLNSPPLTREALKGHVVLIDFWTYSCINCLRTLPYIQAWSQKYKASGLIVIGVHTPEFAFEKDPENVRRAVSELHITYPVALDSDYAIWKAFGNSYWPSDYLIDGQGRIRHHQFGEGKYQESEQEIQALLKEGGAAAPASGLVQVTGTGAEAAPDSDVESPETYIGYERADNFLSPGGLRQDSRAAYTAPKHLELNQWGLTGAWTDGSQVATLDSGKGGIVYRFHARDVHLVLGTSADGKPVRFRVKLDGRAPGANHGVDTDDQGNGKVTEHRLYQLIRQKDAIEDRTFEIEFLDSGVQAFSFTFG